MSSNVRSVPDL